MLLMKYVKRIYRAGFWWQKEHRSRMQLMTALNIFEVNDDEYNLREDETGNIDFKNILEYKTVTAGQVIARVHKGNPERMAFQLQEKVLYL